MRALLFCLALCVGAGGAVAQHVRVSDRVFLVPDKPGSTTRFEMIVNAGSSEEAGGDVRGIAHYLEHLILVGRNAGHGDAAVRMFADASSNGWTNDRATVYLHNLPARAEGPAADIERLFSFYAARLRDFSITEQEAARERNVVLQEHDLRLQSSPNALFYRDLTRIFIPDHPSGRYTVGTRDSIRAMTLEEARAFHKAWYVPNNVWFVVRGNLEPEKLKDIAEKALADIPSRPLPERLREREPTLEGPVPTFRQQHPDVMRALVTVARMVRVPAGDDLRQQAALSLLAAFTSSRFTGSGYDQLTEEQQIAAEDASVYLRRVSPNTVAVSVAASVAAEKDPADLEKAMVRYLDRLASDGIPGEDHLARLKKRVIDQSLRNDKLPNQVHARLVSWLAEGRPPEKLAEWPALVNAITREEIQSLAQALGGQGRQMTGILEPGEVK